jgi:hypothetical protein
MVIVNIATIIGIATINQQGWKYERPAFASSGDAKVRRTLTPYKDA